MKYIHSRGLAAVSSLTRHLVDINPVLDDLLAKTVPVDPKDLLTQVA
jgi:hypothetical protein